MAEASASIELGDLVAVDRVVLLARQACDRWNAQKFAQSEHAADRDPWTIHRKIAGKSVYDALGARPASPYETEIVQALRAHVMWLVLARVTFETEVALARKMNEPLGIVDLGKPRKISWRTALAAVVSSRARAEAEANFRALAECGAHVAPLVRELAQRRAEAARRLGATDMHAPFSPAIAFTRTAARALLDATEDVARDSIREALRLAEIHVDRVSTVDVVAIAVARDGSSGWPSRLSTRWLDDLFGPFVHGLAVDPTVPVRTVGASSFARALQNFGFSLGRAIAFKTRPFVLADDPISSAAHRVASLFGALGTSVTFHRRALGVGSDDAKENARALARSGLLEARVRAARVLLGDAAAPSLPLFEEVTFRIFGTPFPPALLGAWPLPRDDDASQFLATLEAPELARSFVERFDDDWFKNPRAFEALRHALPKNEIREPSEAAAVEAARRFAHAIERALA